MESIINFFFEPSEVLNYNYNYDDKPKDKVLVDEGVLIYAFDIDNQGNIHLIYLLQGGELVYKLLKDDVWSKSLISKFDTRSNYYGQIEILLIDGKPNIFYCFANYISSNIFTLHHVVFSNETPEMSSVARYISKMDKRSFVVQNDSNGYIHLLYRTIVGNLSSIFYTHYNPYSKKWLAKGIKISSDNSLNEKPYIFVDSQSNLHGIWWEYNSNGYLLKYSRMSTTGKNKFKWNDITISKSIYQTLFAQIRQQGEKLILSYGDKNNPDNISSNDFGLTWKIDDDPIDQVPNVMEVEEIVEDKEVIDVAEEVVEEVNDTLNINEVELLLDQLLLNQAEIKLILSDILEEQLSINSRLAKIEETNSKSFFSRLFNAE